MGRARAIQILLVVSGALVACSQLIGLSKLEEGPDPAEGGTDASIEAATDAEAGPSIEGGLPASCFNSQKDPDETDLDCGGNCRKCSAGKTCNSNNDCHGECVAQKCVGCSSIEIKGQADAGCIDLKEVSVADFALFLEESAKVAKHPNGRCDAGSSVPLDWSGQQKQPLWPVRSVDWCTAWAYCKWRGKHLCGSFGARLQDSGPGTKSAWELACEGAGPPFTYPYGNSYSPTTCNGAEKGLGQPENVGNILTCKTIDSGIFDMSGNVAEWDDFCPIIGGGDGRKDRCVIRGGSFLSDASVLRCVTDQIADREAKDPDLGFRCCE